MAKLSKRQKFLRESRSSNSNSWGFSESQLDQLESMYGKGIKQFYEIEKASPQQLSSKRKNFLSMTGKLSDYLSVRLNREALTGYEAYIESKELVKKIVGSVLDPCNLDIVIAMTIAHGGASWDPGGPGSQATYAWRWSRQVAWANAVINDLTPLMNSNNAQVGICAWSGHPHPHPNDPLYPNTTPNPKFPYHYDPIQFSTTSGKWLTTNPTELHAVVQMIDDDGYAGGTMNASTNEWPFPINGVQSIGGLQGSHEHLNKAQIDPANCSLGDRTGQVGFKRIVIMCTVGTQWHDDGFDAVAQAHQYRQTQDIYIHHLMAQWYHFSTAAGLPTWPLVDYQINAAPWTGSYQSNRLRWAPYAGNHLSPPTTGLYILPGAGGTGGAMNGGDVGAWVSPTLGPPAFGEFTSVTDYANSDNLSFVGPNYTIYGGGYLGKICPEESFDCSGAPNFICSDPGTGLGQYFSLLACQANCNPPSWDCDGQGNCYDPGTGNGQYSTLNDCERDCFPPLWYCTNTNQGCLQAPPNTNPASFASPNPYYSLADCENNCMIKRWTCVGRQFAPLNCVMSLHPANAVPSGPGIYSSLGACNANCNQTTWNCTLTGCIDPGDQSGQYFHLNECEDECTVYQCQNLASQGPSTGSIPGCVPFQGGQATLNAGLSAGQLWYNNIWDCLANCYNPSWNCEFDPGQVQQLPTWNCVDPLDGSGSFSLLVDCQNNCGPDPIPGPGYNCDPDLGCIPHTGVGTGQFPTLADCQANCDPGIGIVTPSWDCNPNYPYNCYDPGTGLGQYSTLAACQTACIEPSWDCVNGSCINPGTGLGQYPTWGLCQAACSSPTPPPTGMGTPPPREPSDTGY